jgi:hypothetical protein
MNNAWQEDTIRRSLVANGIDPEQFDVSAHIDSTLRLDENLRNVKRHHGIGSHETYGHDRSRQADLKGEFYQIGRSNSVQDKQQPAGMPGVRYTAWGTTYTERRKNRSDKPGGWI